MPQPLRQTMSTPPRRIASVERPAGVIDRITAMEFNPDDGLNFLCYGESRSGKTVMWSSFPGPILAIICSGGQKPGELLSLNTPALRAKIDTVTLNSASEMDEISAAIAAGTIKHKSGKPYSTVVLDHVSGFQDLKLAGYKGWDTIKQQKTFGDASKKDWGEIIGQLKEHLVKILSLRTCHVVIIGHERIFLPKEDDMSLEGVAKRNVLSAIDLSGILKPKVGVALVPSLTGWLQPAVDYGIQTFLRPRIIDEVSTTMIKGKPHTETIQVRTKGFQYCARLAVDDIFYTKFRLPPDRKPPPDAIILGDSIDGVIKSPTPYEQIMKVINGGEQ